MNKILLFLIFTISFSNSFSQDISPNVISSAGATFFSSSTNINWTLGELAITTIQNSKNIISQGFHQSNKTTSIGELPKEIGVIHVYPNPTSDWLKFEINFDKKRFVLVQLFDVNGNLIWWEKFNGKVISERTTLKRLLDGNYFIIFTVDNNKFIQSFKIQKIQ